MAVYDLSAKYQYENWLQLLYQAKFLLQYRFSTNINNL